MRRYISVVMMLLVSVSATEARAEDPEEAKSLDRIDLAAVLPRLATAERLTPPQPVPLVIPVDGGLWDRPFAPEGLSNCDEMNFYRVQWGLPAVFSSIGWRESNCRNEDGVKTFCCHGYWQLWISLFLRDHRMVDRLHDCAVYSFHDVNSDNGWDKQRQACAARAVFDVQGMSAWST